jgi:hypothetical protein
MLLNHRGQEALRRREVPSFQALCDHFAPDYGDEVSRDPLQNQ